MQFDDRLATVLRMRADGEAVGRTQYRQLVDLLGTVPPDSDDVLLSSAYERLGVLMDSLPEDEQARILRAPGLRIRNSNLLSFLANGPANTAASAVAIARLDKEQWLELIPRLPVTARGFLRHRRDLPPPVTALLERLGVSDLVLLDGRAVLPEPRNAAETPQPGRQEQNVTRPVSGITDLRRRIEAFREKRGVRQGSPAASDMASRPGQPILSIDFQTDTQGIIVRVSEQVAPLLTGLRLLSDDASRVVKASERMRKRAKRHQPLTSHPVSIEIESRIAGEWLLDAVPIFDDATGNFIGYHGRLLRRPTEDSAQTSVEHDAMRQVLHELRTPVNAIQGFAEVIQQQIFGIAPHEYRSHAAAIAADAAKLLAGFDEVDRLAKLDSRAMSIQSGQADLRAALDDTIKRLDSALRGRNASFELSVAEGPFDVALARPEALAICWRILATIAGAMAPGQNIALNLSSEGRTIQLEMDLPAALIDGKAGTIADPERKRMISAGMFGPDFTFRLARVEIESVGGSLVCKSGHMTMIIPALTGATPVHSAEEGRAGS